jgi:hypothetical protein
MVILLDVETVIIAVSVRQITTMAADAPDERLRGIQACVASPHRSTDVTIEKVPDVLGDLRARRVSSAK